MKKENPSPDKKVHGETAFEKMHPKNPLLEGVEPLPGREKKEYETIDELHIGVYQTGPPRLKPKIRTPYNYIPFKGKHNRQPSLTVPNQSMGIDEILKRHTLGLPMTGQRVELWEGDEQIMPDLKGLDLSEIQELREEAMEKITSIRERYAKEISKKEREKLLQEIKQEIEDSKKAEPQFNKETNPAPSAGNSQGASK